MTKKELEPPDIHTSGEADFAQNFEFALGRAAEIVQNLEKADLPLKDSIEQFSEGVDLLNKCESALRKAELRVQYVMDKSKSERSTDDPSA